MNAQLLAARLQNVEQFFTANAHKAVTAGANHAVFEMQLNVVPMVERLLHLVGCFDVPLPHVLERLVREHHTPAKGVVGLVALDHRDVVVRAELFHQQRKVQARGSTANAHDFHVCSLLLWTQGHSLRPRYFKPQVFEQNKITSIG